MDGEGGRRLVPPAVRIGTVGVDVHTPPTVERDQSMEFRVILRNRSPLPLSIPTKARPWYWALDGVHDADMTEPDPEDPEGIISTEPGTLTFSPFETKEITRVWNGRTRTDADGGLLPLDYGEHELSVEVTTTAGSRLQARRTFSVVAADEERTHDDR